ncbi:MAG: hypothetical protein A2Z73_05600 [Deltaproteobacteria bacterium RBG_13_60_28]|nr:MAG: hypothetical protein A2Z73_05600 [Deltaproteobacteria bacterium RBG_13_60_28]
MIRFFFPAPPVIGIGLLLTAGLFWGQAGPKAALPLFHYNKKHCGMGGGFMGRDKELSAPLTPREELLMKVAKEIVVKFIEVGRVSPSSFAETFKTVMDALRQSFK